MLTLSPTLPEAPVLLVLLPLAAGAAGAAARAGLGTLQQQLGPAVRVLAIDEATHPAVVRSFGPAELPASVLVRQGVELWRQPGLPTAAAVASQLQAQAEPPGTGPNPGFDTHSSPALNGLIPAGGPFRDL